MQESMKEVGNLYMRNVVAYRPDVIRLVSDTITSQASTGATISGSLRNKSGGSATGSGGAIVLSGTITGTTLPTGTYSNGATIQGLTLAITAGSAYGHSATGARCKVLFTGGGATTDAQGYFITGSNGTISQLVITSAGAGYTSAPTISIPIVGPYNVVIDLGANFGQYGQAVVELGGGTFNWMSAYASTDGSATKELLPYGMGSSNAEGWINGIASSGQPGRVLVLTGSRYVILQVSPGLDTSASTEAIFSALPT